jgi:transcriptional regulator with XRE-family HTH domain
MPDATVDTINKKEIGARIKKLRKESGLRQWQLAEMIGATQPAIHMYERGVLPEPKRLLELARIGNTTVEWILTGRHWENGSEEMHRVPEEICQLAFHLKDFSESDREALDSALDIIRSAVAALRKVGGQEADRLTIEEVSRHLLSFSTGTIDGLTAALRIHGAVRGTLMAQAAARLTRSGLHGEVEAEGHHSDDMADSAPGEGRKKKPFRTRATGIEAIRGHIYKIDGSLLVINEIIKDKDLRTEFEETLGRLSSKLESKKNKIVKMKKADRGK